MTKRSPRGELENHVTETSTGRLGVKMAEPIEHRKNFAAAGHQLIATLESLVEEWDGVWQPQGAFTGRLGLPVSAGLRRGWVAGELRVDPRGEGSELIYRIDQEQLEVDYRSVSILLISAAGGLASMIIPFIPRLMPLLAISIVLAFTGWLMVVNRLRNSGAEDFLAQLESSVEIDQVAGDNVDEAG